MKSAKTQSVSSSRIVALTLLAVLAILAAGCAGETIGAGPNGALAVQGAVTEIGTVDDEPLAFDDEAPDEGATESSPVASGDVHMARANWPSGFMQAEIYAQLLTELGYTVDRGPALKPEEFFPRLAEGEFDFWANSWPISHQRFFDTSMADGSRAGDKMRFIGSEMLLGGLQGFVVDIPTATSANIVTLDDIANNPELRSLFDTDGDGRAEIAGCDVGWGCEKVIDTLIVENGWEDALVQVKGTHGELFAEQVARFEAGEPVLAYIWTPGAFITQLQPGIDVIWLGVENPDPAQSIPARLPPDQCLLEPCTMGFSPSDILVAANNDFLEAQPVAKRLFEQVKISVLDVSFQTVKMLAGEDSPEDVARHAQEWITANRSDVDRWLDIAAG